MLVLSRKAGETIRIGDNITVTVHRLSGNRVSLGIEAPPDVAIKRGELLDALSEERRDEAGQKPAEQTHVL